MVANGIARRGWPPRRGEGDAEKEQRLLARARDGAGWALDLLVGRYRPFLARYLSRLTGDAERAEALADDMTLRLERRVFAPDGALHSRPWLLRVATDAGLAHLRGGAPRRPPPATAPAIAPAETTDILPAHPVGAPRARPNALSAYPPVPGGASARPMGAAAALEPVRDRGRAGGGARREALRDRLVRGALAELPLEDARCLALHLVAGLDATDVARVLGLTPPEAGARLAGGTRLFAARYADGLDALGALGELAGGMADADLRPRPETARSGRPAIVPMVIEHAPARPAHERAAPSDPGIPAFSAAREPAGGRGPLTPARLLPITVPRVAAIRPATRAFHAAIDPPRMIPVTTPLKTAAPDRRPFIVTHAPLAPAENPGPRPRPRPPSVTVPRAVGGLGTMGATASVPILSREAGVARVPVRSPDRGAP